MSSNLEKIKKEILSVKQKQPVKILAVSKLQPIEKIKSLHKLGQIDFGENYPQELVKKKSLLVPDIHWHLIGNLQKNKVKLIIGCQLIHSVDSLALAQEISKRAKASKVNQAILLQVNLAEEKSKDGFSLDKIRNDFDQIRQLDNISIQGLMTMPPFVTDPEDNRLHFKQLRMLMNEIKIKYSLTDSFCELSMGTSQDYKVAIEEGATWIRLGTILFGDRQK